MVPHTRRHNALTSAEHVNMAFTAEPDTSGIRPRTAHNPQNDGTDKTAPTTYGASSSFHDTMDNAHVRQEEQHQGIDGVEEAHDHGQQAEDSNCVTRGTKRKASASEASPHKAARRALPAAHTGSKISIQSTASTLSSVDQLSLLNFLLSPSSLSLVRPKDEIEDLKTRPNGGAKTRTYAASPFTPFEELINALILSRPIGHMLGVRSIRTLLNPPHNLMSPKLIRDIGVEGVQQALDQARTLHRQKTAEEIVLLADAVTDTLGEDHFDVSLERVREECGHDMEKERAMLQKNIQGMGSMGLDIFGRRIQGSWGEWYPFVDEKTVGALEKLGFPGDATELKNLLDEHWTKLNAEDVIGDGEERKRRVFVRVLERAMGAELEGNLDELKRKALE